MPIEPSEHTSDGTPFIWKPKAKAVDEARAKMSYLVSDTIEHMSDSIAKGDVFVLKGYLSCETSKPCIPDNRLPMQSKRLPG